MAPLPVSGNPGQISSNAKRGVKFEKCTSDKNTITEKSPGFVTSIHIAEVTLSKSDSGKVVDTEIIIFEQYENSGAALKTDLFYHLEHADVRELPGPYLELRSAMKII